MNIYIQDTWVVRPTDVAAFLFDGVSLSKMHPAFFPVMFWIGLVQFGKYVTMVWSKRTMSCPCFKIRFSFRLFGNSCVVGSQNSQSMTSFDVSANGSLCIRKAPSLSFSVGQPPTQKRLLDHYIEAILIDITIPRCADWLSFIVNVDCHWPL